MALSKKIQNLVVGIDTKNFLVKILKNNGTDFKNAAIDEIACEKDLVENKHIFEILDNVLGYYLSTQKISAPDVYVVLPDYFITTDIITLPTMPQNRLKDALNAELRRMYPNFAQMQHNATVLSKTKKQVVFSVCLVEKPILHDCAMACKKHGLNLRCITYSANAIINSFLALGGKSKLGDLLYLHIAETQSKIIYATRGKTICFLPLAFGRDFLSSEESKLLPNFVKTPAAQREIFDSSANVMNNISFVSGSIENQAFLQYCAAQTHRQIAAERILQGTASKKSVLQINFAVFTRYLSAIKHTISTYGLPQPEIAIVNLPNNMLSALKNADFDIKISPIKEELIEPCLLVDYFDLYGAIFSIAFNKGHNFLDKDKKAAFKGVHVKRK
ncbi:MAG: hypothetical protein IKK20_03750 [Clostridia bacterium]|nr:hypothetical protein [Clostridia bacterium]